MTVDICATYDGELDVGGVIWVADGVAKLVDVLDPLLVAVEGVGGETDDFYTARSKVLLLTSDFAKLGRADLIYQEGQTQSGR